MEYLLIAHSMMGNESEAMTVAEVLERSGHKLSGAKKIFFDLLEYKFRGRPLTAMDATGVSATVPKQTLSGWETSTLGAKLWRFWDKNKARSILRPRRSDRHGA